MPIMPLMPSDSSQVASPMPGMMGGPPPAPQGSGGGDLASLLGGAMGPSPAMGGVDPVQGAMQQFDQLAQQVDDMANMFPGSDQFARAMMEALDAWRQQVLVSVTPQPSMMPGASQML